ncbi:MAG: histidine kinase dimerization/phospho-acceptor domain-containing protein, partial [Chitinophagaceae bacterium]
MENTFISASDISMENPIFHLPISDLLLNTRAGIYISDEEDRVLWMNDALLNNSNIVKDVRKVITGKPVMETMGYFQEFMIHPRLFIKRIKELVTNKKPFFGQEFLLKDGRTISLDFIPAFHSDKFCGIIWQVTKKANWEKGVIKQSTKTPDTLSEILDNFHVYYCKINKDADIINCSPFFCRALGYEEEDLLKKNFIDLCASGKRLIKENLQNISRSFYGTKSPSFEVELEMKDGSRKWMQCHFSESKNDFTNGMLLLNEITEQKEIQHELNVARKQAEHAQLAQQQFLASMSHDIRTPLNAIIGMSFLMADTSLSNEQNEYVNILKNASNILLGLLNGVLDFAKIETGKQEVHYREFDLPSLLHSLVDTFSFKLDEKPVKVSCEIDSRIDHYLTGDDVLIN